MSATEPALVLASSSPYRAELLSRLGLPFERRSPGLDETPLPGEDAARLAGRLATGKARAVAADHPDALVIGSDQVLDLDGRLLGKPGDRERALAQLRALSGRVAVFQTAVAVLRARTGFEAMRVTPTRIRFRTLDRARIERYLDREPAFDCAGSARCEGLGISLCSAISADDPTAIIGLPLIAVVALLAEAGVEVP